jgi:hypothetical protein
MRHQEQHRIRWPPRPMHVRSLAPTREMKKEWRWRRNSNHHSASFLSPLTVQSPSVVERRPCYLPLVVASSRPAAHAPPVAPARPASSRSLVLCVCVCAGKAGVPTALFHSSRSDGRGRESSCELYGKVPADLMNYPNGGQRSPLPSTSADDRCNRCLAIRSFENDRPISLGCPVHVCRERAMDGFTSALELPRDVRRGGQGRGILGSLALAVFLPSLSFPNHT